MVDSCYDCTFCVLMAMASDNSIYDEVLGLYCNKHKGQIIDANIAKVCGNGLSRLKSNNGIERQING